MESKPSALPSPSSLRRLIDLDTAVSLHLYTFFHPLLPFYLLKLLELSGDGRLFFPVTLSILFINTNTNLTPATLLLFNLLIGSVLDLLLIGLVKHLIQRPRPIYNKNMFLSFAVDHWSFPSGHSSRVSFIATFCSLFYEQVAEIWLVKPFNFEAESWIVKYFVLMVMLWASITSVSRVLLGRHFVLDVVAGALLGVLEGLLVFRVFNVENLSFWLR